MLNTCWNTFSAHNSHWFHYRRKNLLSPRSFGLTNKTSLEKTRPLVDPCGSRKSDQHQKRLLPEHLALNWCQTILPAYDKLNEEHSYSLFLTQPVEGYVRYVTSGSHQWYTYPNTIFLTCTIRETLLRENTQAKLPSTISSSHTTQHP